MASLQLTDQTGHRRRPDHHRGHAELQSGLLRAGPEGRARAADVSRGDQRTTLLGSRVPGRAVLRAQRQLEPRLLVQEPDLAGEMGLQRRDSRTWPRAGSASRRSLPEIFSWGVAYKGLPKTLIDVDLRYIDYANTSLFGTKVVDGGLGWQSVFVVALGAQYQATDRLTLRGGYLYNTNPIRNATTLFNVQAPGIITNTLTLGASYQVTENVTASLAWMHGFRNAIEGPILQIPGSSVRLDAQVDTLWAGVNIKFGGPKRKGGGGPTASGSGSSNIPPPATWGGADVPATPDAGWPEIPMPMPPLGPAGDATAAPDAGDAATSGADAGGLPRLR